MAGIIGYDELFNFQDDSQFTKALADIAKLAELYDKASKEIKDSIEGIKTANKTMADSVLQSNEKLNAANDSNREEILKQAKAADLLAESNKKLKQTEDDLIKSDMEFERQMKIMMESMKDNEAATSSMKIQLDSLRDAQKLIKKEYDDGRMSVDAYTKMLATNTSKQRELKTELQQSESQLKANSKEIQSTYTSYDQMNLTLARLKKGYKDLSDEERNNDAIGGEMLKQIGDYDAKLKSIDATMGDHTRKVGQYENATLSLRQELKSLVQQIATLRLNGVAEGEEFDDLSARAAKLKHAMKDTNDQIKMMASDTRGIDTLLMTVRGITASFGLAQSAAALLGASDEKLAKSFQELQAIMVTLNSLQELQQMIQQKSAVVQGIILLQQKARVLYTKLDTAVTSENTVVRWLATAAQWALNLAMEANPVTLLITAFVVLTGIFLYFALASDTASEKQTKLNESQKIAIEQNQRLEDTMQEGNQKRVKALTNEIELMKSQGKSQKEVYQKEMELLQLKDKMAQMSKGWNSDIIKNLDENKVKLAELKTLLDSYNKAKENDKKITVIIDYKTGETKEKKVDDTDIKAIQSKIDNLAIETQKAQTIMDEAVNAGVDVQKKAEEEKIKNVELGFKSQAAMIEAGLIAVDKGTKKEMNLKIQAAEETRRHELNNKDLTVGEIAKINAKANEDERKAREDYSKTVLQDQLLVINTEMINVKKNSEEEFNLKKQQIAKGLEISLNAETLTANQKKNFQTKADKDIDTLTREHETTLQTIAIDTDKTITEAKILATQKGTSERFQLELHLQDDILAATTLTANSNINLTDKQRAAILEKAAAENKASKQAIENEKLLKQMSVDESNTDTANAIKRLNLQNQATWGDLASRKAAEMELQQMDKDGLKSQQEKLDNLHALKLISEEDYIKKSNDLKVKATQEAIKLDQTEADQKSKIMSMAKDGAISLMNAEFDNLKQISDNKITNLTNEMNKEVAAAGNNATQKAAITAKFNKKIADEKKKAAQTDKLAAIFQASINTALAVTAALSTKPFLPLGPIMAIVAGGLGLAQVAMIAAKPLPAFAKGTLSAPAGNAWVGERGQELIGDRFGNYSLTSSRAQIRKMKGGERVYTATSPETRFFRSMLKGNALSNTNVSSSLRLGEITENLNQLKDNKERSFRMEMLNATNLSDLKNAFKESISEIPVHQNSWDEKGFTSYLRIKNQRIENMNNRFKTGGRG